MGAVKLFRFKQSDFFQIVKLVSKADRIKLFIVSLIQIFLSFLDLIGVALDGATQTGFVNKEELTSYIESKGIEFKNSLTDEITSVSTIVDSIWAKLG